MNRNETRDYIRQNASIYLEPDRSGKGHICPVCKSGAGKTGTGITTKDGIHFTCWAGCFTHSDIIDIIGLEHGLAGYSEKLQKAVGLFGAGILEKGSSFRGSQGRPELAQVALQEADYTEYIEECQGRLEGAMPYLGARGITLETARLFGCGYDPAFSRGTGGVEWQALIIPPNPPSDGAKPDFAAFTARNMAPVDAGDRYRKAGGSSLFNTSALLQDSKPVFVVEGELDAMSISQAGGAAVALGSVANASKLADFLQALGGASPKKPLIIALDSDQQGEAAGLRLEAMLGGFGVECCKVDPYLGRKDANEALVACGLAALASALRDAEGAALKQGRLGGHLQKTAGARMQGFLDGIKAGGAPCIPTGFPSLDSALGGGLHEGLYVLGAISSLGKTTLAMQMADQIAAAGHDSLVFSLEMAAGELMAKSISRHTYQECLGQNGNYGDAKTARGIASGAKYAGYSTRELALVEAAMAAYSAYADRVFIYEGIGDIGAAQVRAVAEEHFFLTGKKPVVFVDYLQILAPWEPRVTDKQNTDRAVLELKRLSRDMGIPVLAVSSLNRANYSHAISMEAFKESGAIEYSSDVLVGMQLQGAGLKDFDAQVGKREDPRRIELVVLKNRSGPLGDPLQFDYYPMFNFFEDSGDAAVWEGFLG